MKEKPATWLDDVTALRGISVLAVIVFHYFPSLAPGGFLGVDVFFVISGFVITAAYREALASGSTTYARFLLRRVRRLFPSAFVVITFTAVAGVVILEPPELLAFAESLLFQSVYLQNAYFWVDGDYFREPVSKPLLHTWSLAVEEQFYLAFPLVLLFIRRRAPLAAFLGCCVVLSWASWWIIAQYSPKTSFFLTPFRAWQLGLGALVCLALPFAKDRVSIFNAARFGAVPGVILIGVIVTAFILGSESLGEIRSWTTTASVATALLLLVSGAQNDCLGEGWIKEVLVWVGERSYSIYLWHWPLFSLAALAIGDLSVYARAALCIISVAFAHLAYKLVEDPIRRKRALKSDSAVLIAFSTGSFASIACAASMIYTNGLTSRYSPEIATLFEASIQRNDGRCGVLDRLVNQEQIACERSEINDDARRDGVLIIGDSHADTIDERAAKWGDDWGVPIYLAVTACDYWKLAGSIFRCGERYREKLISWSLERSVGTMILMSSYFDFDARAGAKAIERFIEAGFHVVIVAPLPESEQLDPGWHARRALKREDYRVSGPLRDDATERYEEIRRTLEQWLVEMGPQLTVVDPVPTICPETQCIFSIDGQPLYFDQDHLSPAGANLAWPVIEAAIASEP